MALYGGLRRGELWALRAENVDLDDGVIRVEGSWDRYDGDVETKSAAGTRVVPICDHLREYLTEQTEGFYFGEAGKPFNYDALLRRSRKAWEAAGLERIGLHECRHSFASYLDAANVSPTRIDRYMGHANHTVSRRYQHSLDGQLATDAALLDDYLYGAEQGTVVSLADRMAS
jgi:integrase